MNPFERVQQILDTSIGGAGSTIGVHGPFWRGVTREEFIALEVRGRQLLVVGSGAESNLVKSLKGEAPFGADLPSPPAGAIFSRMPAGFPPVPAEDIDFIEQWIDDGCPANASDDVLSWRPTAAPEAGRYDDVWFQNPDLGWAVNSNGEILRTENGGAAWQRQHFDRDVYFRCVAFASDQRGWVGTLSPGKRLFETADGGNQWSLVAGLPPAAPPAICGLCVVNESVVIAAGTNYPNRPVGMLKSVDGGSSWTAWDMRPWADNLIDVYFTSPERGWVVGGKAEDPVPAKPNLKPVVLFTDDGGATWVDRVASIRDTFPLGEWGWKIHFVDDQIGYISLQNYYDGAILATDDGGLTWERRPINDPQMNQNIEGIGFIDADHGWVGGWGRHPDRTKQYSSETHDRGVTWHDANEIGKNINRFRFLPGTPVTGYSSGITIYKYSAEAGNSRAHANSSAAPRLLDSTEPASGIGSVEFEVTIPTTANRLTIHIWDWFGEHVRTLVDEPSPAPGKRQIAWDRTNDAGEPLPPDAFFLRVVVDDTAESKFFTLL